MSLSERPPALDALAASDQAKADFLCAIEAMGSGRQPADLERIIHLAEDVLEAHARFRAMASSSVQHPL